MLFIDQAIRAGTFPNATTLADKYEVSRRTITRDIEYMRDMHGAPIAYDESKRGYYYEEPGYSLPAITIPEGEVFALFIAEKALEQYQNTPLYDTLECIFEKLKSFLPAEITMKTSWIGSRYTFLNESQTRLAPEVWESVTKGLRDERQLHITHRKPGATEDSRRLVDPYHLASYRGEWYLIGFCHAKEMVRRFAISRIRSATVTENRCSIPDDFSLEEFLGPSFGIFSEEEEFQVALRFSSERAPLIQERQWHDAQEITQHHDGTITLTFPANSFIEVTRWVLGWGSHVEVLAPEKLREEISHEIQAMQQIYG